MKMDLLYFKLLLTDNMQIIVYFRPTLHLLSTCWPNIVWQGWLYEVTNMLGPLLFYNQVLVLCAT